MPMNGQPLTQACPRCLGKGRLKITARLNTIHNRLSKRGPSTATELHRAYKFKVGVTAINNALEVLRAVGLVKRWQSGPRQWTYEAL